MFFFSFFLSQRRSREMLRHTKRVKISRNICVYVLLVLITYSTYKNIGYRSGPNISRLSGGGGEGE